MCVRVVAIVTVLLLTPLIAHEAFSADLRVLTRDSAQYKKAKRVAYHDCRTGWWASHCNGAYRPMWGTRCRVG
jgi:hypothetical protein